jgi:hypothetical protein
MKSTLEVTQSFAAWYATRQKKYPWVDIARAVAKIRVYANPIGDEDAYFHQVCMSLRPGNTFTGELAPGPPDEE